MLSEKFGYTNEVNRGFSGLADLLDSGAVLDKNGEPILAHPEKGEENRAKTIQEKLAGGDPLYIYYPGEQFPREVTYNPATGFQVSDQPDSKPPEAGKGTQSVLQGILPVLPGHGLYDQNLPGMA